MNISDVNHLVQSIAFAGLTLISDNLFEIIGATGVIINIIFVIKSYYDKKATRMLQNKLLREKLKKETELSSSES